MIACHEITVTKINLLMKQDQFNTATLWPDYWPGLNINIQYHEGGHFMEEEDHLMAFASVWCFADLCSTYYHIAQVYC